jgi:hypothetical protein
LVVEREEGGGPRENVEGDSGGKRASDGERMRGRAMGTGTGSITPALTNAHRTTWDGPKHGSIVVGEIKIFPVSRMQTSREKELAV